MVHHAQTNNTTSVTSAATNEKVYECGICMKTFSKHSSWWKHKKCHTGERNYKCYICEKSFTQQANLHRVNITDNFRLFNKKSLLVTRRQTITPQRPTENYDFTNLDQFQFEIFWREKVFFSILKNFRPIFILGEIRFFENFEFLLRLPDFRRNT